MHHIVIISIIVIIVVIQIRSFISTLRKIEVFKNVFSGNLITGSAQTLSNEVETNGQDVEIISSSNNTSQLYDNSIFHTIKSSINNYVEANRGRFSDFYLIKDIVDRNCDSKEEEIQTQIPVPLYLGLVGTMIGILVGILFLWLSGGLSDLLSQGSGNGVAGVEALLSGVALSMSASICGITLTTIGSSIFKSAKIQFESDKHAYLSTIHTGLLPNMGGGIGSSLETMSQNLQNFNTQFSKNTTDFQGVLTAVNSASENVSKALQSINKLKMTEIASANIETYSALKNCTDEIGKLGDYLQSVNHHMADTTDTFGKMQVFLRGWLENIDSINIGVKSTLERFSENSAKYLDTMQDKLDGQILGIRDTTISQQKALQDHFQTQFVTLTESLSQQQNAVVTHNAVVSEKLQIFSDEQAEILRTRMKEASTLVEELKSLSSVKNSIEKLVSQSVAQSSEISQLTESIKQLAEMKVTGGIIKSEMPFQQRVVLYACCGVVTSYCILEIIMKVVRLL